MTSLMEQRKAVKDELLKKESVAGSGLHPNDPTGPVKQGKNLTSARPIAFAVSKYDMAFVGDCAKDVVAALKGYVQKCGPDGKSSMDYDLRAACIAAEYYSGKLTTKDGQSYLEIRNAEFNAVSYALDQMAVPFLYA